ncbi:MAG: helix-turn-helix transcriptional regulator [Clostridia bacterium]|nr:helix-turn-helix transcriptional regulator [Clostridia bacterium]
MVIQSILQVDLYENFGDAYPLNKTHRDQCGLILHVGGGSGKMELAGKTYALHDGVFTFLREGEKYRITLDNDYIKCYVLNFRASDMEDFIVQENCDDLVDTFAEAHRLWMRRREDEYFRYDCMSAAYRMLAEVRRRVDRAAPPMRKKERLAPAIEFLHDNYTDGGVRIAELAERLGMSERYLSRLFDEVYGMPPKRYLTELRIKYAKELLGDDISIGDAALKAGFCDASHFTRIFREVCGVSPGEYRRAQNKTE